MLSNCVILDLECLHAAEDCRHCPHLPSAHRAVAGELGMRCPESGVSGKPVSHYEPLGWDNKPALGLSVGCYWDYQDGRMHWFDTQTVATVIQEFVDRQPLLVSFNGTRFDFPLMRGLVRRHAEFLGLRDLPAGERPATLREQAALVALCDAFKLQCAASYDILVEIWKLDPASRGSKGVNSLDALAQANGLGAKRSHGAQAPRDWAAGRYAAVLDYCQDDVYKTKALFELVCQGIPLRRARAASLLLPRPHGCGTDLETAGILLEVL